MLEHWQLQDAKNRFSELVQKAMETGPQVVTRRGVEAVVVLSVKAYRELTSPKTRLVDAIRQSPLFGAGLDLQRSKESAREVTR